MNSGISRIARGSPVPVFLPPRLARQPWQSRNSPLFPHRSPSSATAHVTPGSSSSPRASTPPISAIRAPGWPTSCTSDSTCSTSGTLMMSGGTHLGLVRGPAPVRHGEGDRETGTCCRSKALCLAGSPRDHPRLTCVSVRGRKHVVRVCLTPGLTTDKARRFMRSCAGLRLGRLRNFATGHSSRT